MRTQRRSGSLWRHPDFIKLWAGQAVSIFGTEVTSLALPLTAVFLLKATPLQMGILGAVGLAPYVMFSLVAGVWVDRLRRRPVLIAADLGRAVLLASIPAAALLHLLTMGQLYIVDFLVGTLSLLFGLAYQSFLPSVVGRDRLVEGNGKLAMSASTGQVAGPGLGGALVQALTAPVAILVDAASYAVSAALIALVRAPEASPRRLARHGPMWAEIGEGLRIVARQPALRAITASWSVYEFAVGMVLAVLVLYLTRDLDIAPAVLGWVFVVWSASGLAGASLTGWAARRFGLGPSIGAALLVAGLGGLCAPLAIVLRPVAIPLVLVGQALSGIGLTLSGSNQSGLRQALTPEHAQGRVNACFSFLTTGIRPFGALLGGVLGEAIGLPLTLLVGALGITAAGLWVLLSAAGAVRNAPAMAGPA